MRFRKIALALFACLALGAFAVNAAEAGQWTLGTTENQTTAGANLASEIVKCQRHGTSKIIFTSFLSGAHLELEAEQVDCLKEKGAANGSAIINTVGGVAHSEGVLTFTGVKVLTPAHCEVVGGELTTNALTDEVIMDPSGGTVIFDKFFPENAANSVVTIELVGQLCPLAESDATVKGSACGEVVHTNGDGTGYIPNATGTLTKVQTLLFGATQQTTGGCALTFGNQPAQLFAVVDNALSGVNAPKPFGAD